MDRTRLPQWSMIVVLGTLLVTPRPEQLVSPQITIDQFGWRPNDRKVAILAQPVKGQNADVDYRPGERFEVVEASTGRVVFRGNLKPWEGGAVSAMAGDRVWFADFSRIREPGEYRIHDTKNRVVSSPFRIAEDVYAPVLRDAVRVFYYQRSGTPIDEKHGGNWHHAGAHVGPGQDREAPLTRDGEAAGDPRELSGGWFDAGDLNKYVPYLESTLFDLLWAYELNPGAFRDDTKIPESGNDVPDLLDEVRWELDWLLKMQDSDGGVFNRVAGRSFDNGPGAPSGDTQPRFHTAKTTWATAVAAASWAHAARVYRKFDASYSDRLLAAARKAWGYLEAHPTIDPPEGNDGDAKLAATPAGSNPAGDRRSRVHAAAQLFKTTREPAFREYVDRWATDIEATAENGLHPLKPGATVDPLNHSSLTQALFVYATSDGARREVVEPFKAALGRTAEMIRGATGGPDDPYLAYHYEGHYCWGSSQSKGRWGRILLMTIALDVNPTRHEAYRDIVNGYLHFLHGRNPLSLCYLSAIEHAGGDRCVSEIYHQWFRDGSPLYDGKQSRFGPPPGYVVGGPNMYFSVDWMRPPHGEPPMKAYRDWNGAWNAERRANEASWEISEPAIYYQAAYILLLAPSVPTG